MQCAICGALHRVESYWWRLLPLPTVAGSHAALPALLEAYSAELRSRACSPRTIAAASSTLRGLARALPVELVDATRDHLVEWLGTSGWSPLTRRTYRTTVTGFYAWLADRGTITDNPPLRGCAPPSGPPYREPDPLTTDQVQALLDSGIYARTRMMVLLAAYQGMRVSEIACAHTNDVDLEAGTIRIPDGKGGTDLRRPLHTMVAEVLHSVAPPAGYLFPPGASGRLTSPARASRTHSATRCVAPASSGTDPPTSYAPGTRPSSCALAMTP